MAKEKNSTKRKNISQDQYASDLFLKNENRRLKLVNAISIISCISILVFAVYYSIIDFKFLKTQIILLIALSFGALAPILLNSFKLHQFAKVYISSFDTLLILTFIFLFGGKELGSHTLFLIFSIIPIFIWSAREKYFIIFFYAINILAFIFIEFFPIKHNFPMSFPERYIELSSGLTILLSFLVTTVAIIIFHHLSNQKEAALYEKNLKIEEQKEETIKLNKELNKKIRELSRNKQELEEAHIIQGKIYSIIAHDLRNPASGIDGLLKILLRDYHKLGDEQKLEYLNILSRTSQTAHRLLENLLEWSMVQTNMLKLSPEKLNINDIVNEVIEHFLLSSQEKNIQIKNLIKNNQYAYADRHVLSTVFRNLISNAIKFTPKDGEISLSSQSEDDRKITISISDTGIGMTSRELNKLKKVGENLVKPGTENEKGTGLGLMIVKEFVELNGGKLSIHSSKGEGSTFSFSLTAADSLL